MAQELTLFGCEFICEADGLGVARLSEEDVLEKEESLRKTTRQEILQLATTSAVAVSAAEMSVLGGQGDGNGGGGAQRVVEEDEPASGVEDNSAKFGECVVRQGIHGLARRGGVVERVWVVLGGRGREEGASSSCYSKTKAGDLHQGGTLFGSSTTSPRGKGLYSVEVGRKGHVLFEVSAKRR